MVKNLSFTKQYCQTKLKLEISLDVTLKYWHNSNDQLYDIKRKAYKSTGQNKEPQLNLQTVNWSAIKMPQILNGEWVVWAIMWRSGN